jgi:hypothetical protein
MALTERAKRNELLRCIIKMIKVLAAVEHDIEITEEKAAWT